MNINIRFKGSPADGINRLVVSFTQVEIASLKKKDKSYILTYMDDLIKVEILLKGMVANYLREILINKEVQNKFTSRYFSIQKSGNTAFNLKFQFPSTPILEHDFIKRPYILSNDITTKPVVQYVITLNYKPEKLELMKNSALEEIEKKLKRKQKQQHNQEFSKQKKIRIKAARKLKSTSRSKKESVQNLVKAFGEMEKQRNEVMDENIRIFKKKGIYLTNPIAFKRCENCVSFSGYNRCSAHAVDVYENHSCKRFYSYKTVLGGSFSPR